MELDKFLLLTVKEVKATAVKFNTFTYLFLGILGLASSKTGFISHRSKVHFFLGLLGMVFTCHRSEVFRFFASLIFFLVSLEHGFP